jgi:CRP/FNR family transcriptional regulator, cyclic AMP receptor protein
VHEEQLIAMRPEDEPGTAPEPAARVALLRVDPGLRAAVPAEELAVAERVVLAAGHELGPGTWDPQVVGDDGDAFAALVIRGLVTHETTIAGRRSAELLGPGDLFHPWRSLDGAVPSISRWASDSPALIAALDARFLAASRRWPQLFGVVHERLAEQLARGTARAAIMALPRVEQRVLGLFWQLAERWGKVRREGIVVELALTHELIGQLIGAQRPTVSLALQALARDGLLQRTARGPWLLGHDARTALPDIRPIGPVHTAVARAGGSDDGAVPASSDGAAPIAARRHSSSS